MAGRRHKRFLNAGVLRSIRRHFGASAIHVLIVLICSAAAYVFWLDSSLVTRLASRHWSLPARLYANPLDVFPGQKLGAAGLEKSLIRSGYRLLEKLDLPGEYHRGLQSIDIYCRRFNYWDGTDPERRVRIEFGDGVVTGIHELPARRELPIVRIEPPLIGRIYPESEEDRLYVSYSSTPRLLIEALVAAEDQRFFEHAGLDLVGMSRALWIDLVRGELAQGGSTLTQQLIKNLFLTNERSFWRKFNEILMALLLERHFNKEQILEAYINEVYLGQHGLRAIHGFGAAAEFYFERPLDELGVEQLALLVGLVRGASYYNPRRYPQRAVLRRNSVLERMEQEGYLDGRTAASARSRPLGISAQPGWTQAKYPAVMDTIRRQLQRDYRADDLRTMGLRIFTTVDPELQELASSATSATLAELERGQVLRGGSLEAATVLVRISSGDILAAVGGRLDATGDFNRSIDARRPIGSLVKPFIYLTALSDPSRYNVLTLLDDSPLTLKQGNGREWRPKNYDAVSHGEVTVMEALANSYNLATVRLGLELGLDRVINTLRRGGISTPIAALPSLLLGAIDLSPIEVAQLYQALANGGFSIPLNGIRDVVSGNGRPLRRHDLEMQAVFDPAAVYLTDYLLQRVVEEGTARALTSWLSDAMPVAGKTGTTDDLRDSWFAGFGDGLLAVTWVGRDDNRPMGLSGATGAMRIWAALMQAARLQPLKLQAPANVRFLDHAQLLYRGDCRMLNAVPYIEPNQPGTIGGC